MNMYHSHKAGPQKQYVSNCVTTLFLPPPSPLPNNVSMTDKFNEGGANMMIGGKLGVVTRYKHESI